MNRPLVLACGALVRELRAVLTENGLGDAVDVEYQPASLHNRPDGIVPAIRERISAEPADRPILVAYADCGTGGELDRLLDDDPHRIVRLPGDHCYSFLAGLDRFTQLHAEELGSFFLTDFLARHFDALVWQGLGLDHHPELRDLYFAGYRRVVLLTQSGDDAVLDAGRAAADQLGLDLVIEHTGREPFAQVVRVALDRAVR